MLDINEYFIYLEKEIEISLISDNDKNYLKLNLSLFKVSGTIDILLYEYDTYEPNPELELYILFEFISQYVFTVVNYQYWIINY